MNKSENALASEQYLRISKDKTRPNTKVVEMEKRPIIKKKIVSRPVSRALVQVSSSFSVRGTESSKSQVFFVAVKMVCDIKNYICECHKEMCTYMQRNCGCRA